jgi:hypothetical protein
MTNELSLDDLDQASGGWTSYQKGEIAIEKHNLLIERIKHEITPAQANSELQRFEVRLMLQSNRFHI